MTEEDIKQGENNEGEPEVDEGEIEEEQENNQTLIYKNRAREMLRLIAVSEEFEDIRISRDGIERLNGAMRYIFAMLAYEMIDILKKKNRKTINPMFVDDALSKIVGNADALGITIGELQKLIGQLNTQSQNTSISKAVNFINLYEQTLKEE